MKRAGSTIPHSTFPQGMNYFTSQTEAKNSFKSRAEGCWSYCCLHCPGQRSNYVGFKGLFFYLPSWHASAGRSLHSASIFHKWKPRGGTNLPRVTDSNLPTCFLIQIEFFHILPNRAVGNFPGAFFSLGDALYPRSRPPLHCYSLPSQPHYSLNNSASFYHFQMAFSLPSNSTLEPRLQGLRLKESSRLPKYYINMRAIPALLPRTTAFDIGMRSSGLVQISFRLW